jgi:hypothetical protein
MVSHLLPWYKFNRHAQRIPMTWPKIALRITWYFYAKTASGKNRSGLFVFDVLKTSNFKAFSCKGVPAAVL